MPKVVMHSSTSCPYHESDRKWSASGLKLGKRVQSAIARVNIEDNVAAIFSGNDANVERADILVLFEPLDDGLDVFRGIFFSTTWDGMLSHHVGFTFLSVRTCAIALRCDTIQQH